MKEYLQKLGIGPNDSMELQLKKFRLLLITLGCMIVAPIGGYSYYQAGLEDASLVPLAYLICMIPGIIYFITTNNHKPLLHLHLVLIFACPVLMQWLTGGFLKGGIVIMWSFFAPLTALVFMEIRIARLWMVLVGISIIFTAVFNSYLEQYGTYTGKDGKILQLTLNMTGVLGLIYFTIQYFVETVNTTRTQLEDERMRSESLLKNILPEQVAEELKLTGKTKPTLYRNVTIIFSDFKDFTQFSELFTPEELIEELDNCFHNFDEIILRNGLEKIKTIGDAYMCVAGISSSNEFPAMNAVRALKAALEMAEYMKNLKKEKLATGKVSWDMRIGVHTGDVVAGIIGKHKFAFDVWGDAVNIASRLETCGEEGRINISGQTHELVKDHFQCYHRGRLAVKNKGELDMYFVESMNDEQLSTEESSWEAAIV